MHWVPCAVGSEGANMRNTHGGGGGRFHAQKLLLRGVTSARAGRERGDWAAVPLGLGIKTGMRSNRSPAQTYAQNRHPGGGHF